MQALTILGSTGSIGVSTLDVLARHPERFEVHALTAHTSVDASPAAPTMAAITASHSGAAAASHKAPGP